MSRIALLGGSFNPPHLGHQVLCLMVLEATPIDELWLLPTYRHFFGKDLADFDERVVLCKQLIAPLGERCCVLEIERDIGSQGRMLDTVKELQRRSPEHSFRLVMGADILEETDRWYRWPELASLAEPIVFQRHGFEGGELPAPPDISSTQIREQLAQGLSAVPRIPIRIQQYIDATGLYR
jgi:nicotinate-nucleotide adenylyltransferase